MTILQMAMILCIFYCALRVPEEPVRDLSNRGGQRRKVRQPASSDSKMKPPS
jgi:hypothetical protein